jgi:hypothetical protein
MKASTNASSCGLDAIDVQRSISLRLQLSGCGELSSPRPRDVTVNRHSTVGELKADAFADELARGYRVRFIFLGRQLADYEDWWQVKDGSVVQCFLSLAPPVQEQDADERADESATDAVDPSEVSLPPVAGVCEEAVLLLQEMAAAALPDGASPKIVGISAIGLCCAWCGHFAQPSALGGEICAALSVASIAWPVLLAASRKVCPARCSSGVAADVVVRC